MWQIADATGWSVDYILNGVNYQTLIMMLSDAPRYVRDKKEKSAEDEAREKARMEDRLRRMEEARQSIDQMESLTAAKYWPYPTYADILFSV